MNKEKSRKKVSSLKSPIIKEEMNLAEFPFTLLSHRTSESQKTIEVAQQVRSQNGRFINQRWIVTGSDEYGLPLATDNDIYLALMQVFKEDGFKDRTVHFTRYQLLKVMGKAPSKQKYNTIEGALDRLISVVIKSENAFWDNEAKAYVTKAFHLFESYDLYDERVRTPNHGQPDLPLSNVVMSEFLFNSIKSSYIKKLDIGFYFTLQTPLTRRLYRFLDRKRHQRSKFEIDITTLSSLLPLQDQYHSQIKRRLEKAHWELIEKKYLAGITYKQEPENHKETIAYFFEQPPLPDQPELILEKETTNQKDVGHRENTSTLLNELIDRKITKATAQQLIASYPADQIGKQIEIFDWLAENESTLIGKNPAGFLRKAVEENYEVPIGYSRGQEEMKKKKEEQEVSEKSIEQAKADEIKHQVKEYREQLTEQEKQQLRQEAEALIKNDKAIREEFVTEFLFQAKEAEIIKKKLGL